MSELVAFHHDVAEREDLGLEQDRVHTLPNRTRIAPVRSVDDQQGGARAGARSDPVEFREIILLREYEELSYQEIAVVLRCLPGTVMSRLGRARSRLRVLLSDNVQTRNRQDKEARE